LTGQRKGLTRTAGWDAGSHQRKEVGIMEEIYEAPELTLVGNFTADTGINGVRNDEEINWHFDTWN
jgi:hypothetical protein